VGNELYSFGRGGLKDAEFCAVQTRLFAQAMKKSDPTIQLVGCTHFGKGNWNRTMIGEAGEPVETFSVHDYLLDRYKGDISGIAKSPTMSLRSLLENARASLQSDFPKDHKFTLAFDEWNTRWGLSGSVSMGLYTAGVLNLLCREANSMQIGRAYYFMPVNEGAIKVMPLGSKLDPSGEVFALFAPHQGNRLLNIPLLAAGADLDLCASITPDGKNIYVTVVNRNAASDHMLELAVSNFKGPKEATLKLLFPQPDDADARFFQHNEKLKIVDRNGVFLKIPPYGVARVHLGIQKKSEGRPPKARTTKII
jgi:alpha-L-arabinofuranosidase